jgi:hypothetical protein
MPVSPAILKMILAHGDAGRFVSLADGMRPQAIIGGRRESRLPLRLEP